MFGRVSDVIAPRGLESPTERRVYVRPASESLMSPAAVAATGWGANTTDGWWGLSTLNAAPTRDVIALFTLAGIVPSLVAVALAANLDGERRTRRRMQLSVLGARATQQAIVDVAEAYRPVGVGIVSGLAVAATACAVGFAWPQTDFILPSGHLGSAWPSLALSGLLSLALGLATLLAFRIRQLRGHRRASTRKTRHGPGRNQVIRSVVCFVAAGVAILVPANTHAPYLRTMSYAVGVLVVVITLPAIVGIALQEGGQLVARWAWKRGQAGALLGGRRLAWSPTRTSRLALAVCAAVLLLGQVQLWASALNEQYDQALQVKERLGTSVLHARHSRYGQDLDTFVRDLPGRPYAVWTWLEPSPDGSVHLALAATCSDLLGLGIGCDTRIVADSQLAGLSPQLAGVLADAGETGDVAVRSTPPAGSASLSQFSADLYLVSRDGASLPVDDFQQTAFRSVGGLQLERPGQGWLAQGVLLRIRAIWTIVWGLLGVLAIALSAGAALAGDAVAGARQVAPLAALSDARNWMLSLAALRVGVPLTLAGLLGSAAYLVLPSGLSTPGLVYFVPSVRFAAAAFGVSVVASGLACLWCYTTLTRESRRWRPGHLLD